MKLSRMILALVIVTFATGLYAQATPVGVWKTIDDETGKAKSHVKIYESNGKLFGQIIELIDPSEPDPKCTKCTGAYKDKPVKGMVIMWNLSQDGKEYSGGQILDPNNGKTYTCKLWIENGNLRLRGYIGPFYRTQTWYRLK